MPSRSYQKGRALEYALKQFLEQQDWLVIRSAGSHSPADLIALRSGKVRLIQVQQDGHLPKAKRDALKAFAQKAGQPAYFAHKIRGRWLFEPVYPEPPVSPIPQPLTKLP